MLNASGMNLADLYASITLKLRIKLTIPQHVVYHPVHISYSVCRYYNIHSPPLVYTLSKASGSVTTLEAVGLRQATGDIIVTPVSGVTEFNSLLACDHAGDVLLVIKCNSMLARDQDGDFCM